MRLWTRVKDWLPALAWAGLICGLSTDAFSSNHTSVVIVPVLRWLFSHASAETIELMHEIIRKMAHFTEYFIFSIFLLRGLRGTELVPAEPFKVAVAWRADDHACCFVGTPADANATSPLSRP